MPVNILKCQECDASRFESGQFCERHRKKTKPIDPNKCSIEGCNQQRRCYNDELYGPYCDTHGPELKSEWAFCFSDFCVRWCVEVDGHVLCSRHGGADYIPRTRVEEVGPTPNPSEIPWDQEKDPLNFVVCTFGEAILQGIEAAESLCVWLAAVERHAECHALLRAVRDLAESCLNLQDRIVESLCGGPKPCTKTPAERAAEVAEWRDRIAQYRAEKEREG
jgi:hypothetical protein